MMLEANQEDSVTSSSSTITAQTSESSNTINHIQLYDEFVSRGNVAVLKCLVVVNTANGVSHLMSGNSNGGGSNSVVASSSSSGTSSSSSSTSGSTSSSSSFHHHHNHPNLYRNYHLSLNVIFEWRIKNGPAASPLPPIDPIMLIRSNQTQGKCYQFFFCYFISSSYTF